MREADLSDAPKEYLRMMHLELENLKAICRTCSNYDNLIHSESCNYCKVISEIVLIDSSIERIESVLNKE